MLVIIRADASKIIGGGHISRMLVIAKVLVSRGHDVYFFSICNAVLSQQLVVSSGCSLVMLGLSENDTYSIAAFKAALSKTFGCDSYPDWIIVDLPDFNEEYTSSLGGMAESVLLLSDYAACIDEEFLVLNPNYISKYDAHVYENCVKGRYLYGLEYILVNDRFIQTSHFKETIGKSGMKILVSLGMSDVDQILKDILRVLSGITGIQITVLLGGAERPNSPEYDPDMIQYIDYVEDVENYILNSNMVLCSGGNILYEALVMGKPAYAVSISKDQDPVVRALKEDGFISSIKYPFNDHEIQRDLHDMFSNYTDFLQKAETFSVACSGYITAGERVVDCMEKQSNV